MEITSTTFTLQLFFSSNIEQFIIPAYQRRYAWGERQQRELFEDILHLPSGDTHLLGTVLCLTGTYTPGVNQLELVDGQQRITTLAILFLALAEYFDKKEAVDAAAEMRKLLVCRTRDRKIQPKVLLGDLDNDDFVRLMANDARDEIENERLLDAYEYFTEWLSELDLNNAYVFADKLCNAMTIIRLNVSSAKDAYKLFETINNRGLRLRPTDIIKNFLLGHASTLSNDILDKVRKQWSALIVALDYVDSDDFFRQWLAGKLHRKVTTGGLVTDFKTYYVRNVQEASSLAVYAARNSMEDEDQDDDEDVSITGEKTAPTEKPRKVKLASFVTDLRKAADLYANLLWSETGAAKIDRHLTNLDRIKAFQSYTLLLDMFQRPELEERAILRLLKMLEAFMMRRHVCEKRTNELETIFAGLTGIPDDGYEKTVIATLREHTPDDEEFQSAFASFPFVPAVIDRARYALEMFEYDNIGSRNEFFLAAPDEVHVEHIIPKAADRPATKSQFGDWPTYLGAGWKIKHDKLVHRIGNMTLLAQALNINASNHPFEAKRNEYSNSNISLTMELANMNNFKFKAVEERSQMFAEKAVRIWKV